MSSTYKLWFWLGTRKLNDRCQRRAALADSSTYLDRIIRPESHWASCHRWAAFPVWNKKCTCFRSVFCFYIYFILTLLGLIVVGIFNLEGIFLYLQKNKNESLGFFFYCDWWPSWPSLRGSGQLNPRYYYFWGGRLTSLCIMHPWSLLLLHMIGDVLRTEGVW